MKWPLTHPGVQTVCHPQHSWQGHACINSAGAAPRALPRATLAPCFPSPLPAGLALGIWLLGLPWRVAGIMLAGDLPYYTAQQDSLTRAFLEAYGEDLDLGLGGGLATSQGSQESEGERVVGGSGVLREAGVQRPPALPAMPSLPLEWVPRVTPRRFGSVLPGEVAACKQVGQQPRVRFA